MPRRKKTQPAEEEPTPLEETVAAQVEQPESPEAEEQLPEPAAVQQPPPSEVPVQEPSADEVSAGQSVEPVSGKGVDLLPADLLEVFQERARRLARPPEEDLAGETTQVVVFALGQESYAVEAAFVETIVPLERITPVPCTPDFVVGVINLRGRILSVIDLHRFLGQTPIPRDSETQVIAVRAAGLEVGILANQVRDVQPLLLEDLRPALPTASSKAAAYTRGLTPGMVVFLDLQALLKDERIIVWQEVG